MGGLFIFELNFSKGLLDLFDVLSSLATLGAVVVSFLSLRHLKNESRTQLKYAVNKESLRLLQSIIHCFGQIQVLAKSDTDEKSKIKGFEDQFRRDFELLKVTCTDDNSALSLQNLDGWLHEKVNDDSIEYFLMCTRELYKIQGFDDLLNEKNRKLKGFHSALLKSF